MLGGPRIRHVQVPELVGANSRIVSSASGAGHDFDVARCQCAGTAGNRPQYDVHREDRGRSYQNARDFYGRRVGGERERVGERFLRECESSAGPTKWEQVRSMPMRLAGKLGRQDNKTGPFLSGTQDSIRREATSRLTKFRYCWRWRKASVRPQKNENRNKLT